MKWVKVAVAALLVGFLAGFVPMYMRVQDAELSAEATRTRLEAEVHDLRAQLKISQLHGQLGMLLLDVEDKNFGNAQQRSSQFFNRLQGIAAEIQTGEISQHLEAITKARDEITAGLATADVEIGAKIRKLYIDLAGPAGVM